VRTRQGRQRTVRQRRSAPRSQEVQLAQQQESPVAATTASDHCGAAWEQPH